MNKRHPLPPEPHRITRDVTREECSWLRRDRKAGEIVYRSTLPTYGMLTPGGFAASDVHGEYPVFELPRDAVAPVALPASGEGEVGR